MFNVTAHTAVNQREKKKQRLAQEMQEEFCDS
jgi:hypothetical protein